MATASETSYPQGLTSSNKAMTTSIMPFPVSLWGSFSFKLPLCTRILLFRQGLPVYSLGASRTHHPPVSALSTEITDVTPPYQASFLLLQRVGCVFISTGQGSAGSQCSCLHSVSLISLTPLSFFVHNLDGVEEVPGICAAWDV